MTSTANRSILNENIKVLREVKFMLKIGIYLNLFVILGLSIAALVLTFRKKSDLKKIAILTMAFATLNFYSLVLLLMDLVETDWDVLFLAPVGLLTWIINIVTTILSFVKLIKADRCKKLIFLMLATPVLANVLLFAIPFGINHLVTVVFLIAAGILMCKMIKKSEEKDKLSVLKIVLPIILPVLIVGIPFAYESYIISNCEYVIKYNYQSGWVNSEDTYLAIINKKPVEVTLHSDAFGREGEKIKVECIYVEDFKSVNDDKISTIVEDAKNRYPKADQLEVIYFGDGNAIVSVMEKVDESRLHTIEAEYFYYNNEFIKDISDFNFVGDLEEVIYYK